MRTSGLGSWRGLIGLPKFECLEPLKMQSYVASSGRRFSRAIAQFLPGGLSGLSAMGRCRVTLKANEGMNFIRTGCPRSDLCNKNSTTTSSSYDLRYCWLWAFSSIERRPRARWWRVVWGILPWSARVWFRHAGGTRRAPVLDWLCPYQLTVGIVMWMETSERQRLGNCLKNPLCIVRKRGSPAELCEVCKPFPKTQ
jgi:hypothetical protein